MTRHFAIVPAAGSGARFGSEVPKQYLELAGKPMIFHALAALCRCDRVDAVWVVLSPGDEWWASFDWSPIGEKLRVLYCGGSTRAETVGNGLAAIADEAGAGDFIRRKLDSLRFPNPSFKDDLTFQIAVARRVGGG